jgi:hypothetical protein
MASFDVPGDIALSSDGKHFVLSEAIEALAAKICLGFLVLPGTWEFDLNQGFPMFDASFVVSWKIGFLDSAIRVYLESFEEVEGIKDLQIELVESGGNTIAQVTFELFTIYGDLSPTQAYLPMSASL